MSQVTPTFWVGVEMNVVQPPLFVHESSFTVQFDYFALMKSIKKCD